MRSAIAFVAVGFLVLTLGCQATSLAKKETHLRDRVNDLYVDQAMDALVRAKTYQPFVIMDYSDFQFTGTDSIGGGAGFGYEHASIISRTFNLSAAAERKELIGFSSNPVVDRNDMYKSYMEFAHTPGLLNVTSQRPANPYLCKEHCGTYYWIPCEAAPVFMTLVMKGSLMLETVPQVPIGAYEREILHVEEFVPEIDPGEGIVSALITFDDLIPASPGTMIGQTSGGKTFRIRIDKPSVRSPNDGELIGTFEAQWNIEIQGTDVGQLKGQVVRVYSDLYPLEEPEKREPLDEVIGELKGIRTLQFLQGGRLQ